MAKLHDRGNGQGPSGSQPEQDFQLILEFLRSCRKPAVLEAGDKLLELTGGNYLLELRSGRLSLEVWSDDSQFCRRILSVEAPRSGLLDCEAHRFGGKPAKLTFLDLERPQTAHRVVSGERRNFAEQFRRMLFRSLPGWEVTSLSSEPDLRRSFSGTFPRARLRRGQQVIAAAACASPEDESDFLTSALLWFDHVAKSSRAASRVSLRLFLPEGSGSLTAQRLRWLRSALLQTRLFLFNEHGSAGEVDPEDLGNIETRVSNPYAVPTSHHSFAEVISALVSQQDVQCQSELSGALSLRFRGIEFARIERGRFLLGVEDRQEIREGVTSKAETFLAHLRRLTNSGTHNSQALSAPERWLESAVRSNLHLIDPTISTEPLHGQVLTFAAGDRNVIDLLGISESGRLTVLELKATADLHLPVQALDYWMRIRWHGERAEINHLFPSRCLLPCPPRLLLVAPALSFHSTNSIVLRYFSPEVEVERVGVNSEWQHNLRVVLRLSGADDPISHGRWNGHTVSAEHQEGAEYS